MIQDHDGLVYGTDLFRLSGTASPEDQAVMIREGLLRGSMASAHAGADEGKEKPPEAGGTAVRGVDRVTGPEPCVHQRRLATNQKTDEVGHCCV